MPATTVSDERYFASVNGKPVDNPVVSAWDFSFQRGLSIFEVIRILPGGLLRAPELHWNRMVQSAAAISAEEVLPPKDTMMEWMAAAASQNDQKGEGYLRIIITLGAEDPSNEILSAMAPSNVYILWHPLPRHPPSYTLLPMYAPWHTAGRNHGQPMAKVTSYGPNVLSSRRAKKAGYSDALLLTDAAPAHETTRQVTDIEQMFVLDGPNFAVGWIGKKDNQENKTCIYFPSNSELGLLISTTQQLVTTIVKEQYPDCRIEEGIYRLYQVLETAEEMFVMSSTRGIIPVTKIGEKEIGLGPMVPKLKEALMAYTMSTEQGITKD